MWYCKIPTARPACSLVLRKGLSGEARRVVTCPSTYSRYSSAMMLVASCEEKQAGFSREVVSIMLRESETSTYVSFTALIVEDMYGTVSWQW